MPARFTHHPLGYNTEASKARMVKVDGEPVCRISRLADGRWSFFTDWAGVDGMHTCMNLECALEAVKMIYMLTSESVNDRADVMRMVADRRI